MNRPTDDDRLKIRRVASSADPDYADLLRIYTEAHPASERKTPERLARMIERPEYFFLTVSLDSSVVAFSIANCFLDSDAALLEYMAVEKERRDQGIGQHLFRETVKFGQLSDRYMLIEVDSDKKQSADQSNQKRRKAFYARLGCREIEGLRYIMPPVSSSVPPAMELFVYRHELPPSIETSRIREWLTSCYVQVYGKDAGDPQIESMLGSLPPNLRLI